LSRYVHDFSQLSERSAHLRCGEQSLHIKH
jgi:hypothetical protein